jgi:aspartate kinase
MTIDSDRDNNKIVAELQKIAEVEVRKSKAIICAVGEGISHTPYIAGRIFAALGKHKINVEMISQGASKINITFVVDNQKADSAVKILHKEFCE